MTRSLPPRPSLDYLKRDARRILRTLKAGRHENMALMRAIPKYHQASFHDIASAVTLLEVQQALAHDYGFAGWKDLKTHVESTTPALRALRPVLGIGSLDRAVEHYRDWLGFALDWEWREAPGQSAIASFSRDEASFMVNEFANAPGPAELHLDVRNLDALIDEWNGRRGNTWRLSSTQVGRCPHRNRSAMPSVHLCRRP